MPCPYEAYLQKFIKYKNVEVGFSFKSIEAYQADIRDFLTYLRPSQKKIADLSKADIEDYIATISHAGYKAGSVARKMSALKQFCIFLYLEGHILENPFKKIKFPKAEKNLPDPLSIEEIEALLRAATKGVFPHNLRLVCLLELAYGTGMRVSELVSLPLSAVAHGEDYIMISGKGRKQRLVPFGDAVKKALEQYLPYRMFFCRQRESLYLFPSVGQTGHLTRVRFFQILKSLSSDTNIPESKLSPHNFRHSFATTLLKGGADLKSLQSLLGHENISTTEIYTHLDHEDIKKALNKTHPLAMQKLD